MLRRKILRKLRKNQHDLKNNNKTEKYEKDLIKYKFKLLNLYYNKYALK